MRGVSEVIAIILILMITISLAGLAYMFMSTTMSDVTSSAGSTVDTTTSSMATSFIIESISQGKVYVRNTGQNALTGLSVYVSDQPVNASVPASIASGAVGTINVTSIIFEGDTVKVTSGNGVSASKTAPSEWYGAVGYWKFDEGSGLYAYDSSPYGNIGTLTNGPTWTSGRYGNGLLFDGSNDHVNCGTSVLNASQITITAWMNTTRDNWNTIVTKQAYGSNGYWFGTGGDGVLYFYLWSGGALRSQNSGRDVIGDLHFVAVTYNGSSVNYFVDGISVYSYDYGSYLPIGSSSANFIISASETSFAGTIDEVAIWNRALTSQEILKLYNK